jgi:hypothetical protein
MASDLQRALTLVSKARVELETQIGREATYPELDTFIARKNEETKKPKPAEDKKPIPPPTQTQHTNTLTKKGPRKKGPKKGYERDASNKSMANDP